MQSQSIGLADRDFDVHRFRERYGVALALGLQPLQLVQGFEEAPLKRAFVAREDDHFLGVDEITGEGAVRGGLLVKQRGLNGERATQAPG